MDGRVAHEHKYKRQIIQYKYKYMYVYTRSYKYKDAFIKDGGQEDNVALCSPSMKQCMFQTIDANICTLTVCYLLALSSLRLLVHRVGSAQGIKIDCVSQ